MNKSATVISSIAALALWVIAFTLIGINRTYSNLHKKTEFDRIQKIEERVVPVIGRAVDTFDGLGVSIGFVVKDAGELRIVRYDRGSMADKMSEVEGFGPKFLRITRFNDGKSYITPVLVNEIR